MVIPSGPPSAPVGNDQPINSELIRKTRLDPSRTFAVHVIYQNGREIARYKTSHDRVFDMEGKIPDGEVKFSNDTTGVYGVEHYVSGHRHGLLQEHYSTGQIKKETVYSFDQVLTNKEFFIDGILRMEEDFSDALPLADVKEVGVGKVYDRKGTIKYEWNLTQGNPERFNKAYNAAGEWVLINHFDEKGKLIRTEKKPPPNEEMAFPVEETVPPGQ